jgi:hypothetical protein
VLSEPDGLLAKFFDRAADEVRGHALGFVGRSLPPEEPLEQEVEEHLQSLWESRLATARATRKPADHSHELGAVGWWFGRGNLSGNWALAQLLAVLRLGVRPEPMHVVMERLPAVAQTRPLDALEALRRLAELDTQGWELVRTRNEVRAVLGSGLTAPGASVPSAAVDLTHWLGARGMDDLSDLLSSGAERP